MTITMGDLVCGLVEGFEHRFHDHALAVAATEVMLMEILRGARTKRAPRMAERRHRAQGEVARGTRHLLSSAS